MNDIAADPPQSAARRNWMVGAVAAAAAVAGGGLAWWQQRGQGGDAAAIERLWGQSFDTPQGGSLAFAAFRGKPVLVNFWATWCPPCVEEMPLLDRFYRQHTAKGWQVVGLAVDQPSAVRSFLQKTPVTFAIGLAGLEGTELAKALGNQSGGLPFTVVIGPDGTVRQRRMGRVSDADLQAWSGLS